MPELASPATRTLGFLLDGKWIAEGKLAEVRSPYGHTYRIELVVEGEAQGGMLLDFALLKAQLRGVLARYDHRYWNDFMEYPTVENISERLAGELGSVLGFPFSVRVHEGHAKWAETGRGSAR